MTVIDDDLKQKAKELWLEGKKYKEISDITGIKESTIKSFASRMWKKGKLQPMKKKVAVARGVATKNNAPPIEELLPEEIETLANIDLTEKQRLFCLYYARYFNATRAYKKAYDCDELTAMASGSRLLGNVKVKAEIQAIKDAKIKQSMFSTDDLFQKYMDIAFYDINDFLSFGQENIVIDGIEIDDVKVNTMKLKESSEIDGTLVGEVKQGKDGVSIKLADRMKALEWLGKHIGLGNEEQRARIDLMNAQRNSLDETPAKDSDSESVVIYNDV